MRYKKYKRHLGYKGLEKKIERSERKAHPNYSQARISYIAHGAAGKIARAKRGF